MIFRMITLPDRRHLNELGTLKAQEILLVLMLFTFFIGFLAYDIVTDYDSSASIVHLTLDYSLGAAILFAMFFLVSKFLEMKIQNRLVKESLEKERDQIQLSYEKLNATVSTKIDTQFSEWKLTEAEKEVALLLIKGFAIREIATLRGTSEKTVRHQSLAVYSKSGTSGRNELSASFIEDFMENIEGDRQAPTTPLPH